jgi:hypothetical protein
MAKPFRVEHCRCSTDEQDAEIRADQLVALGVPPSESSSTQAFPAPPAAPAPASPRSLPPPRLSPNDKSF